MKEFRSFAKDIVSYSTWLKISLECYYCWCIPNAQRVREATKPKSGSEGTTCHSNKGRPILKYDRVRKERPGAVTSWKGTWHDGELKAHASTHREKRADESFDQEARRISRKKATAIIRVGSQRSHWVQYQKEARFLLLQRRNWLRRGCRQDS